MIGRFVSANVSAGGIPKLPVSSAWVGMLGLDADGHDSPSHGGPNAALSIGEDGLVLELTLNAAPCDKQAQWFIGGRIGRISAAAYPGDARWYARVVAEGRVEPDDRVEVTSGAAVGP